MSIWKGETSRSIGNCGSFTVETFWAVFGSSTTFQRFFQMFFDYFRNYHLIFHIYQLRVLSVYSGLTETCKSRNKRGQNEGGFRHSEKYFTLMANKSIFLLILAVPFSIFFKRAKERACVCYLVAFQTGRNVCMANNR